MTLAGGPSAAELADMEARVRAALRSGGESGLNALAWGEIGPVIGWPDEAPAFALKRLPPFRSRAGAESFGETLHGYIDALAARGLACVQTGVHIVEDSDSGRGGPAAWVVQPLLPAECMGPALLRAGDPAAGHPVLDAVLEADLTVPCPTLALDGQLSNFAWVDGRLLYIDVTPPLLFDERGELCMDMELLIAALPAPLRPVVMRLVIPDLMRRFRVPRAVVLDMLGNLLKEKLDDWLPAALERLGGRLPDPISEREVRRAYSTDKKLWEALLQLRRLDRGWQRRVRRREYPFLLPGRIER